MKTNMMTAEAPLNLKGAAEQFAKGNPESGEWLLEACRARAVDYMPDYIIYDETGSATLGMDGIKFARALVECAILLDDITIIEQMFRAARQYQNIFKCLPQVMAYAVRRFGFQAARQKFLLFTLDFGNRNSYGYGPPEMQYSDREQWAKEMSDICTVFLSNLVSDDPPSFYCIPLMEDWRKTLKLTPLTSEEMKDVKLWLSSGVLYYKDSQLDMWDLSRGNVSLQTVDIGPNFANLAALFNLTPSFVRGLIYKVQRSLNADAVTDANRASLYAMLCRLLDQFLANKDALSPLIFRPYHPSMVDLLTVDDFCSILRIFETRGDNTRLEMLTSLLSSLVFEVQGRRCAQAFLFPIPNNLAKHEAYACFYFPLLEQILPNTQRPDMYKKLLKEVMNTYFKTSVGGPAPAPVTCEHPRKLPPCSKGASCDTCKQLNAWLADDKQTSSIFIKNGHWIGNQITKAKATSSLSEEMTNMGRWYTKRCHTIERDMAEWDAKCAVPRRAIAEIAPETVMRRVLGDKEYDEFMGETGSNPATTAEQNRRQPLGNTQASNINMPPPPGHHKRTASQAGLEGQSLRTAPSMR